MTYMLNREHALQGQGDCHRPKFVPPDTRAQLRQSVHVDQVDLVSDVEKQW